MSTLVAGDLEATISVNQHDLPLDASVLVCTYNHAQYLNGMLRGIAAQQDVTVELIVVDDASTDHTREVVRAFARKTTLPFTYVRFTRHRGKAAGRNCGLDLARSEFCAFTDADCVPSERWLCEALRAFERDSIGMVQGRTECQQKTPAMLTHFIETLRVDGSFSTSNIVYRRSAIGRHRFDSSCRYWEDTDLGFRVRQDGWEVGFAKRALVFHAAIPQSAGRWVMWPIRYWNWPAKAARYPEFRRTLFLSLWVRPLHACFDLALGGAVAAGLGRRRLAVAMIAPYMVAFTGSRGLKGRAPVGKIAMYIARDCVAFASLLTGSIRYRTVVL